MASCGCVETPVEGRAPHPPAVSAGAEGPGTAGKRAAYFRARAAEAMVRARSAALNPR